MKEIAESILFVAAVVVLVVVLPLLGLWKLRKRRNQKGAAAEQEFEKGLRSPNYSAFRARYRCDAPAVLRDLYESPGSNLEGDFQVRLTTFPKPFFIAYFMGMVEENMSIDWPGTEGFYAFASDGSGNRYVVDPKEPDPNVYFYDHELQEPESLKMKLSEFLSAQRVKARW